MKSLYFCDGVLGRFGGGRIAGVMSCVVMAGVAVAAPPPPARFSEEAQSLFAMATSRYFLNGTISNPVKMEDALLVKIGGMDDTPLKQVAGNLSDLLANQKQQMVQAKKLGQPVKEEDQPAREITLADVAAEPDGEPTLEMLNEGTELLIQGHKYSRSLRAQVAEICKRDQPKVAPVAAPLEITFVAPGCLQIVNNSTLTLHHCVMTTSSTMFPDLLVTHEPGAAQPAATGTKEERRIQSGRAMLLGQQAMRDERGFFTYLPELRGGEVLKIPFCDIRSLAGVKEVKLSFWSDESSSENAVVRGLLEYRQQAYADAKLWQESHKGDRALRWNDPLITNEKLEIPQSYSRDAKGTKLDHQPETSGWQ